MKKKKENRKKRSSNYQINDNTFSEPEIVYQKTGFKSFSSFSEMNEADAKERANISPEQHLINTTQRIKEMYADELKAPMDKTLKFRQNE